MTEPSTTVHSVFIYFKAATIHQTKTQVAINTLGTEIATKTGASFSSARRADPDCGQQCSSEMDTWLEHYRCVDDETARAVLTELNAIATAHPLLALIDGGFKGRHLEYFLDTSTCV